eukprot:5038184-Pyramimonas_sp.AAC.1
MVGDVLKNDGKVCYVCMRVWHGRYHPRAKLSAMPAELGKGQEAVDKFMGYRTYIIDKVLRRSSRVFERDGGGLATYEAALNALPSASEDEEGDALREPPQVPCPPPRVRTP